MEGGMSRRDFLKLTGVASLVLATRGSSAVEVKTNNEPTFDTYVDFAHKLRGELSERSPYMIPDRSIEGLERERDRIWRISKQKFSDMGFENVDDFDPQTQLAVTLGSDWLGYVSDEQCQSAQIKVREPEGNLPENEISIRRQYSETFEGDHVFPVYVLHEIAHIQQGRLCVDSLDGSSSKDLMDLEVTAQLVALEALARDARPSSQSAVLKYLYGMALEAAAIQAGVEGVTDEKYASLLSGLEVPDQERLRTLTHWYKDMSDAKSLLRKMLYSSIPSKMILETINKSEPEIVDLSLPGGQLEISGLRGLLV